MALIRLEHVTKRYRDRIALSDVTLSFEPGEPPRVTLGSVGRPVEHGHAPALALRMVA